MDKPSVALMLVVVLGVGAQWIAHRLRLPSILLLLLFGLAAGAGAHKLFGQPALNPDGLVGRDVVFGIVSIFVAIVLFDGGLSLRFREFRRVGRAVIQLMTIAVVVAWVGGTAAAYYIAGLTFANSVMMGAILVVTGPTVIIPLLRQVRPSANVASVLKWEGIVNDPVGAILAVLVFEAILTGDFFNPSWHLVVDLLATFGVGAVLGAVGAAVMIVCLRRYWIPDAVETSVILMIVGATFVASNLIKEESGLLAVTIMGIAVANQKWAEVSRIIEFKEHLASLLVAILFIVLASRVTLDDLSQLDWNSVWFVVALIVVVRPLTVLLSTFGTRLNWRERAFVAWMAPRGVVAAAVMSLFALRLSTSADSDVPAEVTAEAGRLVPIMFLVILGTILVYGLSAIPLSKALGVATTNRTGVLIVSAGAFARAIGKALAARKVDVLLIDTNLSDVRAARMDGLRAWHGDVLSQQRSEQLETPSIGRALILTPNDQVNALIAIHLTSEFGRREVYRVRLGSRPASEGGEAEERLDEGRLLFDEEAGFHTLNRRLREGWTIKSTKLTEEFDMGQLHEHYKGKAIVLAVVRKDGKIAFNTADAPLEPEIGQTVIALVDDRKAGEIPGASGEAAQPAAS